MHTAQGRAPLGFVALHSGSGLQHRVQTLDTERGQGADLCQSQCAGQELFGALKDRGGGGATSREDLRGKGVARTEAVTMPCAST